MINLSELSKEIAYALRHSPDKYGLKIDQYGWTSLNDLLNCLKATETWKDITKEDIIKMIDKSSKKRYEINEDRIRAFYGHSIEKKIIKEEKIPPDILYHGTSDKFINSIKSKGILSQSRQYVHLSQDIETAKAVAKRKEGNCVIIVIDSKKAWRDGIKFYYANEKVWLVDFISNEYFIDLMTFN